MLDTPRLGCINVHGSLLPRWRGAAPIQRAIETGDTETGITIMQMDAGLDTGPMLSKMACDITDQDTTISVFEKLTALGTNLLIQTVNNLANDPSAVIPVEQDNALATYAEKITKQEAMINWNEPAAVIHRKIRAFNPFPIAYSELDTERVKIYRASIANALSNTSDPGKVLDINDEGITISCGSDSSSNSPTVLRIEEIQLPGKKAMTTKAILLGNKDRFKVGDHFSVGDAIIPNSQKTNT